MRLIMKKKGVKLNYSAYSQNKTFLEFNLTVVRVVGFIVQHQFIIDKVEGVGARLERVCDHFIDELGW